MAVWQDKFIQPNKFSRPQLKLNGVKKLIIHWTANFGATAENHYNYFNTLKDRYASAHLFVDKTEALCIIPLNEVAYQANDGTYRGVPELKPNANFLAIGVEMCVEKDGSFHPNTISRTEDVFVELCKKFNLDPLKDIVRHYDVTHKNCPAPWVSDSSQFEAFKKRVNAKLHPVPQPKPAPTTSVIGKVTVLVDSLWVYSKADWNAKKEMVKKGDVFTVVKELTVDGYKMYQLKSGLFITASTKYVKFSK